MKTAMQELIERLRIMMKDLPADSSRALGLATAADLATDLNEKESQQIIDAYNQGYRDGEISCDDNGGKLPLDVSEYDDAINYLQSLNQ